MPLDFQPNRLAKIIEKVRKQHPQRKNDASPLESGTVDEVRKLLEQTAFDQISSLALGLNQKQLLACIEIVAIDGESNTAKKAAQVVTMRPRENMIVRAWFHLVKQHSNSLLERLLKDLISSKGFAPLANHPEISNRLAHWLMHPNLVVGIFKDYKNINNKYDLNTFLNDNFISDKYSLHIATWQRLLLKGSCDEIKCQSPIHILRIFEETMESSLRMKMCQHYLNTLTDFPAWDEQIIEYIHDKWGQPKSFDDARAADSRFWEGINHTQKLNYNRWLMNRAIKDFFEGERADFWRQYVDNGQIIFVEKILNGNGFMLNFGKFGAIEFKNKGNAAYVYPKMHFDYFRDKARFYTKDPKPFKDKAKTIFSHRFPDWNGRIHHNQRWKKRTKPIIDALIMEQ